MKLGDEWLSGMTSPRHFLSCIKQQPLIACVRFQFLPSACLCKIMHMNECTCLCMYVSDREHGSKLFNTQEKVLKAKLNNVTQIK